MQRRLGANNATGHSMSYQPTVQSIEFTENHRDSRAEIVCRFARVETNEIFFYWYVSYYFLNLFMSH